MTHRTATWSLSHDLPPDQAADLAVLVEHVEAGAERVPCRAGAAVPPAAWTSDDRKLQAVAADACLDCPVFMTCRTYALRWAERLTDIKHIGPGGAGAVYGGLTADQLRAAHLAQRPPKRRRTA